MTTEPTNNSVTARILVQDDEETIREIVALMLTSAGFECRAVATPKATLKILKSNKPVDLVLCGISEWPEKDFKRMTATFPDVPVVVLTAAHDIRVVLNGLRMGAYDFLLKPFRREQLIALARRALEYRRLKLEIRALRTRLEGLPTRAVANHRGTDIDALLAREKVMMNEAKLDLEVGCAVFAGNSIARHYEGYKRGKCHFAKLANVLHDAIYIMGDVIVALSEKHQVDLSGFLQWHPPESPIRNPGGHSFPEGTEQRAIEYISLLSLLAYRVQEAKRRRTS